MIRWLFRLLHGHPTSDPKLEDYRFGVKQSYRGFDERAQTRAALRAAVCEEQRRLLAAKRSAPDPPARRRRKAPVIDITRTA